MVNLRELLYTEGTLEQPVVVVHENQNEIFGTGYNFQGYYHNRHLVCRLHTRDIQ